MLQPGEILAERYLLNRTLASGGFGVTFLAHDQKLHGKLVVVKIPIIPSEFDPDYQGWQQNRGWYEKKFRGEILALARIDHPGVVSVLDSGVTSDGQPFLVMQFVEGQTLRKLMTPEGLPLERVADLVRQIGNAIAAAHDKGIWHRDLKPENIMVQALPEGDQVRLIDFGLASLAELSSKSNRENTRVSGSLAYMAPEQFTSGPSAASDLYAFGIIAYELVAGRKPFIVSNPVQLIGQQQSGVRLKPRVLRPELTVEAEQLILKALSYDVAQRPSSVRGFGAGLAAALRDTEGELQRAIGTKEGEQQHGVVSVREAQQQAIAAKAEEDRLRTTAAEAENWQQSAVNTEIDRQINRVRPAEQVHRSELEVSNAPPQRDAHTASGRSTDPTTFAFILIALGGVLVLIVYLVRH